MHTRDKLISFVYAWRVGVCCCMRSVHAYAKMRSIPSEWHTCIFSGVRERERERKSGWVGGGGCCEKRKKKEKEKKVIEKERERERWGREGRNTGKERVRKRDWVSWRSSVTVCTRASTCPNQP